jgi:hypothetical protein
VATNIDIRTRPTVAAMILTTFLACGLAGCGVEQVAPEHREIILQLATASSTRDPKLLAEAAAEIDRLAAAKELGDGEARAFGSIREAAAAGDWDRARDLAYALRDGQEPTAEDLDRVAKRTLRAPRSVESKAKAKPHR